VGVAYDADAQLYLVAYREGAGTNLPFDKREPLLLDVYDRNGQLVSSSDTGLTMDVWYRADFNPVGLELDGAGRVTFHEFRNTIGVYRYRD
jgi:hypothetical protein